MPAGLNGARAPRVLMTADAVGGVWTYALDLARGLAGLGVQTTLALLGPAPSADQRAAAGGIDGLSLRETGLDLDWLAPDAERLGRTARTIAELAAGARADVVHLNTPALAAAAPFPAPVLGACHSCLATWWRAVKAGPMPSDFRWRTDLVREGLAVCGGLIAPTRAFARETALVYGVAAPRVVPNGRSLPGPRSVEPREPSVLTAGRLWDEGKNAAVLDRAAGLGGRPLYLAGPVASPDGATARFNHGIVLGALSSAVLAERFARSAIYASAALYEPFGLSVLEAAGAGCALVLSDIATHRELWDGAAVFVDPHDPAAYAAAFERLLGDPPARRALADQARARASRYGVAPMTAGVLEAYRVIAPAFQEFLAGAAPSEAA